MSQDPTLPEIRDRRGKVPGVLPKNAQAWVLIAIALLMVFVIALSGGNSSRNPHSTQPKPAPAVMEANQARIQEYRAQIDQEARRLAVEQAQLAATKQALGMAPEASPGSAGAVRQRHTADAPMAAASVNYKDSIGADERNREWRALYASNIALTYRKDPATLVPATGAAASAADLATSRVASGMSNADLESARVTQRPSPDFREDATQANVPSGKNRPAIDPELRQANGKLYRLLEGTMIETVLTNRLDGTFSGPVNCMVTTNIYSHDRQHLLAPQGTRILGEVRKLETFGDKRLAVFFHRLIMPDGYSLSLDKFQGLNQLGETGLTDLVNHHYLQIFGVSLAIGAIAGFSQANTQYGLDASAADAYRQGVGSSLAQSSLHVLDRYLNILPTITIREGHRIKIYLSNDLLLPAYDRHEMPDDL